MRRRGGSEAVKKGTIGSSLAISSVQQAKVEVSGLLVNVSSAEWVPVEAFSLEGAKKNVDFHQMGFFDRAFDLDVLVAPPGYVLTGIRFRRIGTHLNPEIRVTPIDLRQ
ncbi:Hypothetical predicted protein, partial [Cloeon dipterum]